MEGLISAVMQHTHHVMFGLALMYMHGPKGKKHNVYMARLQPVRSQPSQSTKDQLQAIYRDFIDPQALYEIHIPWGL